MNLDELLAFVDAIVTAKTDRHLKDVEECILRGAWDGQNYEDIALAHGYTPGYFKQDVGPKLWRLLSDVFGERVSKTNFRRTIERHWRASLPTQAPQPSELVAVLEAIAPVPPLEQRSPLESTPLRETPRCDWGDAGDVPIFYGRTNELATLHQWLLQDHCRVVAILGMGGMGKTSLSLKLSQQVQPNFEYVIWRSLLNAPPVEDVLANLINFLSNYQAVPLADTVEGRISQLLQHLRTHRCLLLLDNAETILMAGTPTGQYRSGYEGYGQLFKQIGDIPHQSCLILTSREKPREIALAEGRSRPVRSLELRGLSFTEGKQIFTEMGDFWGSESDWQQLIQLYNGSPLALELTAKHISEVFFGNIAQFLRDGKPIFYDLRELLDWHFNRLSSEGCEIVYWLAINREPISLTELRDDLASPFAKQTLATSLQSLQRRWTLERTGDCFTLQPVLLEYVTDRLVDHISQELSPHSLPADDNSALLPLLTRYALLKASAKDYIRESQQCLILQPILDRLLMVMSYPTAVEAHLKQLLNQLRQFAPHQPGYAAGNILNLLCHLNADLVDYDFSHLTIWQAYLRGVNVYNVNFYQADVAKTVFTQVFGSVSSVAFSPDGQFLATGGSGEIHLWRIGDRQLFHTYHGHENWVWSVAISPNGQWLASGSEDQTIKLWNVQTGACVNTLQGHQSFVLSVAFSPDSQWLVSSSCDQTIKLWNVQTGACVNTLQGHTHWIRSAAFNPDGQQIVSGSCDRTLKLWNVSTGECLHTLQGHSHWVSSAAFSPDGQQIVSGSCDRTLKLWNVSTGDCITTIQGHSDWVIAATFSPDGRWLASSGEDQLVKLWSVQTGECLNTLQGHTKRIWSIAFSPDGQTLASGSDDQTVRFWRVRDGKSLYTLQGHSNSIRSLAFNANGQVLASASDSSLIRLWDSQTGICTRTLKGHTASIKCIAFCPSSPTLLASASEDQTVKLWDTSHGSCLQTLRGHINWVCSVTFSRNGQWLASCGLDQTVRVWRVADGECVHSLKDHGSWVWSVAFSPDGQRLASGGEDSLVRLWDVQTGECLQTLSGHTGRVWMVAYSPFGELLATASFDHTIRLWNARTGDCLRVLRGHTNTLCTIAFSPNGQTLASGGGDCTLRVWDVTTGQSIALLQRHTDWVTSVTFSPDGEYLASSGQDETLKLWQVSTGECMRTLHSPRPYEGLDITGVQGLTEMQKATLRSLGAREQ